MTMSKLNTQKWCPGQDYCFSAEIQPQVPQSLEPDRQNQGRDRGKPARDPRLPANLRKQGLVSSASWDSRGIPLAKLYFLSHFFNPKKFIQTFLKKP